MPCSHGVECILRVISRRHRPRLSRSRQVRTGLARHSEKGKGTVNYEKTFFERRTQEHPGLLLSMFRTSGSIKAMTKPRTPRAVSVFNRNARRNPATRQGQARSGFPAGDFLPRKNAPRLPVAGAASIARALEAIIAPANPTGIPLLGSNGCVSNPKPRPEQAGTTRDLLTLTESSHIVDQVIENRGCHSCPS